MPFCPKCRCEYNEGIEICTDCEVDLIAEEPLEFPEDHEELEWVELHTFPGTLYSQMATEMLYREGIPAYSFSRYGASVIGASSSGDLVGVGSAVYVLESDHESALGVIEPMIEEIRITRDEYPYDSDE